MPAHTVTLDDQHWQLESYRQRMTTNEWRQLLLNHDDIVTFKGRVRKLLANRLGGGVVEVFKAPLVPPPAMPDIEWSYHKLLASHIASRAGVNIGHADFNHGKPLEFETVAGVSLTTADLRAIADHLDVMHDLARKAGLHDDRSFPAPAELAELDQVP